MINILVSKLIWRTKIYQGNKVLLFRAILPSNTDHLVIRTGNINRLVIRTGDTDWEY